MPGGKQLWKLVESGKGSDFTIVVNDGENPPQEFKVLKLILENSSPVFQAMFELNLKEANTGIMEITDFEPDVIKCALRNIYGCKLDKDLKIEKLLDLLRFADKYQIDSLAFDCGHYVMDNLISTENCPKILTYISLFGHTVQTELKESCFKVIEENAREMCQGELLMEIHEDTLAEILDLNKINLDGEMDVINFVKRWAMKKTDVDNMSVRDIIEPKILSKLRVLTLTKQEITEMFLMDMLTPDELKILVKAIGNSNTNFPQNFCKTTVKRNFYESQSSSISDKIKGDKILLGYFKQPSNSYRYATVKLSISKELQFTNPRIFNYEFKMQFDQSVHLCAFEIFPPIKPKDSKKNVIEITLKVKVYSGNEIIGQFAVNTLTEYNNSTIFAYSQNKDCYLTLEKYKIYSVKFSIDKISPCYCYSPSNIEQILEIAYYYNKIKLLLDGDVGPLRSIHFLK